MTDLAKVRALIEADPATYGVVSSWQTAEAAHAKLHACDRAGWRDVPVSELAGLWELQPWAADPLVSVRDQLDLLVVGNDAAAAVAKKALRILTGAHVQTLELSDPAKRTAILGLLDKLKVVGMSDAAHAATVGLAQVLRSVADEEGIGGPEACSSADVWEAFGWPGRNEPGKRPANRDPLTGEWVP